MSTLITPVTPVTKTPITPVTQTPVTPVTHVTKTPKKLMKENNKLWREIHQLNREIAIKNKTILENESIIFKTCEHEWEYDKNCGPYDRIKYKCTKCNLWKSNSMYR